MEKSKVYFTKDISEEGLIKIYEALNRTLKGKIAIKISTGEMGGHNYLDPNLIKGLVQKLNGTIVECNTAYPGKREGRTTRSTIDPFKKHSRHMLEVL